MPPCGCSNALQLTSLGQKQVGLLAHEMSDTVVDGIDGLLHGLHSQPQCPVLLLQHGVLPVQVTVALGAVLPDHPLALDRAGREQSGAEPHRVQCHSASVLAFSGCRGTVSLPSPPPSLSHFLTHSSCLSVLTNLT